MRGATTQRPLPSHAPKHVPLAETLFSPDEPPTAPETPARTATPPPLTPSFRDLPEVPPRHLVTTDPGLPAEALPEALERYDADEDAMAAEEESALESPTTSPPRPAAAERGDVVAAPASLWRRVLAWLTDATILGGVVGAFFGLALVIIGKPSFSMMLKVAAPAVGVLAFVAFVYTTVFALLWHGRTPGRRLVGIYLVDATGQAPQTTRAVIRAILALASFGLFLSGFWLALFDRKGQTLHDKLTSTFVVRLKPAV
jgi:uncharacterized RDD family membrane protein YckC